MSSRLERDFGEQVVQNGWLSRDQLNQVLSSQALTGGRLDTCLIETGSLSEDRILEALSQTLGVPAAASKDLKKIKPTVRSLLPEAVAQRLRAIPFRIVGGELWVALEDPSAQIRVEEAAAVSGKRLRPHVTTEARMAEALEAHYGLICPQRLARLLAELNRRPSAKIEPFLPPAPDDKTKAASVPLTAAERARLEPAAPPPLPAMPEGLAQQLKWLEAALSPALERDEIGRRVLMFWLTQFRRALLLRVDAHGVHGWQGAGQQVNPAALADFHLAFDRPSVFLNLHQGAGLSLGPLPEMPAHQELARLWKGGLPAEALVMPVNVRGRTVAVLYGDRGKADLKGLDLSALHQACGFFATALDSLLVRRKARKA